MIIIILNTSIIMNWFSSLAAPGQGMVCGRESGEEEAVRECFSSSFLLQFSFFERKWWVVRVNFDIWLFFSSLSLFFSFWEEIHFDIQIFLSFFSVIHDLTFELCNFHEKVLLFFPVAVFIFFLFNWRGENSNDAYYFSFTFYQPRSLFCFLVFFGSFDALLCWWESAKLVS